MGKYILKRILFFIPTLIIISLLAFIISINAPGDPLDRLVSTAQNGGELNIQSANTQNQKTEWRHKLGLDLPVFYFSIASASTPDTLYKFYDDNERNALKRLIATYGNWTEIDEWYLAEKKLNDQHNYIQLDSSIFLHYGKNEVIDAINKSKFTCQTLISAYDDNIILTKIHELQNLYAQYTFFNDFLPMLNNAVQKYTQVKEQATPLKNYIPVIHFYPNNQYRRWIFGDGNWLTAKGSTNCRGLIHGDFGISYETKLNVGDTILSHMRWSLLLTCISVLLAYLISLPLGIKAAAKKNSLFDRSTSVILFILYSMPTFFVATLLLMTFANTDVLPWLPASGIQPAGGIPADANFFEIFKMRLPYFILPVIAYTYAQLAFLSRITRVATLEIISQDYIRTARAKGLSEKTVIYKHVFRNSLLPIITVFANIFPLAIGGSVILETIFTIPGMGHETYQAILSKDYPVIIDVFTITGVLTLLGYLIADILYAFADPRISYSSK